MTRKEEINEQCFVNGFNDHDKELFTIGAEWADSRPRKGLVDIEKVCMWLKEMMQGHLVLEVLTGEHYETDLIKDFKKAMEGGEE